MNALMTLAIPAYLSDIDRVFLNILDLPFVPKISLAVTGSYAIESFGRECGGMIIEKLIEDELDLVFFLFIGHQLLFNNGIAERPKSAVEKSLSSPVVHDIG